MASTTIVRRVTDGPTDLRRQVGRIVTIALLLFASIVILAPIYWTFVTSLRLPAESFSVPPRWLPTNPQWQNYSSVFAEIPLARYVLNSMIITVSIVLGQLITASLAGYAFARLDFPYKNVLFWLILATTMIPLQATIIPVFVLISRLGLADTHLSLIIPALPTAFGTFLMRQYFLTIPNDFEEAGLIDGASQWQIFFRIYLPLALPGMAILAILAFNGHWNEFFRPLIFLTTNDAFTLPLGLVTLFGYMGAGNISVVLAGVVLSLIPTLAIYLIGQRYLVEGLMMGGVKG